LFYSEVGEEPTSETHKQSHLTVTYLMPTMKIRRH